MECNLKRQETKWENKSKDFKNARKLVAFRLIIFMETHRHIVL